MEAASPDLLTELVRITARTSAVIFVAALAAGAAEVLASPSSSFSRRVYVATVGALILRRAASASRTILNLAAVGINIFRRSAPRPVTSGPQ